MSDDVDVVRTAYESTVAAGPTRITCDTETHWQLPQMPEPPKRNAAQQAAIGIGKTAAKAVGKGFLRLISRRDELWNQHGEGLVDCATRRMMLDYGHFAMLQIGDEQWSGRSGRRLATLPAGNVRTTSPLWLLELVAGVDHASRLGPDPTDVDQSGWHGYAATASLPAAIAVHGRSMSSPAQDRYEDLLAIPFEVWIDDADLIRRIVIKTDTETNQDRTTLTLREFDVDIEHLDWTRLPTFRSPEEAWKVSDRSRDRSS